MSNYCPNLFNSIAITKQNELDVKLGHCCTSTLSRATSIIDFNNEFLVSNRKHYLQTGQLPDACNSCVVNERKMSISKRLTDLIPLSETTTNAVLKRIDYKCDSICNLKCIMCGSHSSSAWISDEIKLGFRLKNDLKVKPTKHNTAIFNLDVAQLETIYFNGGEPLMSNDHINVLTYIIENTNAKNVSVVYNTNGTFPITDKIIAVWDKFKRIRIGFSIDAIGDAFEYIRFPANWNQVQHNLIDFQTKKAQLLPTTEVLCHLGVTLGIQNIMYFDELLLWAKNNSFDLYIQSDTIPGWIDLSIKNFPIKYKNQLIDYLKNINEFDHKQSIINTCAQEINGTGSISWINRLNELDSIRGTNWKQSLIKLYNFIGPA